MAPLLTIGCFAADARLCGRSASVQLWGLVPNDMNDVVRSVGAPPPALPLGCRVADCRAILAVAGGRLSPHSAGDDAQTAQTADVSSNEAVFHKE